MHAFHSSVRSFVGFPPPCRGTRPALILSPSSFRGVGKHSYSAAIHILYANNTFLTSAPDCILSLPHFLLPARIEAIRTLRFEWMMAKPPFWIGGDHERKFREHEREWHDVWRALASMRHLRSLHVKLIADTGLLVDSPWRMEAERIFRPVAAVTAPEDFLLLLPWLGGEGGEDAALEKLPCRVGRWEFVR